MSNQELSWSTYNEIQTYEALCMLLSGNYSTEMSLSELSLCGLFKVYGLLSGKSDSVECAMRTRDIFNRRRVTTVGSSY